jgi:hypothetical protein
MFFDREPNEGWRMPIDREPSAKHAVQLLISVS